MKILNQIRNELFKRDEIEAIMESNENPGYKKAKEELENEILDRNVYLEYDRYQDDKYGRILAWVWIGCEKNPKFLPYDYMYKSNNKSKKGLPKNPTGCKKGKLVNEELVKSGLVKVVFYKDRGELKYQKRLLSIQ